MKNCCFLVFFLLAGCNTNHKPKTEVVAGKAADTLVQVRKQETFITTSGKTEESVNFSLGKQLLISAGQTGTSEEIIFANCRFDVVVDERSDTLYLATSDRRFSTPEKLKVGMKMSLIPVSLKQEVREEKGWGYYIPLPSGWNLGFCEGQACTDEDLTDDAEVKWIFKRK